MSEAPNATTLDPAGAAVIIFTISFTIAGLVFVPSLVRPTSSRQARQLSVICLICSFFISAFLAFFGAFNGTAANGGVQDGRYFVGEHGYYHEVSSTTYTVSRVIDAAALVSWLVLAFCGRRLHTIQQNKAPENVD